MKSNTLTKKDINKVFYRWAMGSQISWNYETMQSGGVVLSLGPALEKIYADDPELLKEKLHSHFRFFNTQPYMGAIIMGAALAVEETKAEDSIATVTAIKTGLMGPLAGVGDSLFFVIPFTILGALSAYMALDGSALGILINIVYGILLIIPRKLIFDMGYKQGSKFVNTLAGQLKALTNAANILGVTVIGALIASTVKLSSGIVVPAGEDTVPLVQIVLDMIMPNLLPAALVAFIYWLSGRKGMTSIKIVLIVIALSIVGYATKLFAG